MTLARPAFLSPEDHPWPSCVRSKGPFGARLEIACRPRRSPLRRPWNSRPNCFSMRSDWLLPTKHF